MEVEAGAVQKSLPANGKKAAKRAPHEQIAAMEWNGMCPQLPQPHGNGSHFRPGPGQGHGQGVVGIGMRGREMDTDGTLALALGVHGALLLWPDEGLRSRL